MSLKYIHVPNVSQLFSVPGASCNVNGDCASINNSTCNNSTCVCVSGFVANSTKKTCLPGTYTNERVYHTGYGYAYFTNKSHAILPTSLKLFRI